MKKYIWLFVLSLLPLQTLAEEIDLLSDEMLLGNSEEKKEVDMNLPTEEDDDDEEEGQNTQMFGFIKPIIDFFSSDENEAEAEDEVQDDVSSITDSKKVSPKPKKKETLLEKSIRLAEEGSLKHQMNLGYMYLYGTNGVKQDFEKSFKYYDMAAQQNNPIATNNLGSLYFNGIGVERDIKTALKLFERAVELGNDDAAVNLAFIYLTGGKKDPVRNQKAVELFKKASNKNKIARFMLGYAYYKGFVVDQDMKEAYKLIKATAHEDAQIDEAQIVLAQMYISGQGTVQNYQSAIAAYRSAVNQGNMEAYQKLADIYIEGKLTAPNPILAHTIYNVAAAQGNKSAAKKRDELGIKLDLENLKKAQEAAREFKINPSELTSYIRQTYGGNIRHYIDLNM